MKQVELFDNDFFVPVTETELRVELGWDPKTESGAERVKGAIEGLTRDVSAHTYDLNLAAILEYDDAEPELIFFGHKKDEAECVHYLHDDRTGRKPGVNEEVRVRLDRAPASLRRIVLFANIYDAAAVGQHLGDVRNVFTQVVAHHTEKVIVRDEDAYRNEAAKNYSCYLFGALCRKDDGWHYHGISRYSNENKEGDTIAAFERECAERRAKK